MAKGGGEMTLDEQVAVKLGWVQCCNPGTMENGNMMDCFGWSKGGSHFHQMLPPYSTDIGAAWEIVQQHDGYFGLSTNIAGWTCYMQSSDHTQQTSQSAKTAPESICKAFLELK